MKHFTVKLKRLSEDTATHFSTYANDLEEATVEARRLFPGALIIEVTLQE